MKKSIYTVCFSLLALTTLTFFSNFVQAQQIGTIVSGEESTVKIQNALGQKPEEPTIIFRVGPETGRDEGTNYKSSLGECDSTCAPMSNLTPPRPNNTSTKTYLMPVMPLQGRR